MTALVASSDKSSSATSSATGGTREETVSARKCRASGIDPTVGGNDALETSVRPFGSIAGTVPGPPARSCGRNPCMLQKPCILLDRWPGAGSVSSQRPSHEGATSDQWDTARAVAVKLL